jgi:hypothetical protein
MAGDKLSMDASLTSAMISEDLEQQAEHSFAWLGDAFRMVSRMQEDMDTTLSGIEVLASVKGKKETKHGRELCEWEPSKPRASAAHCAAPGSSPRAIPPHSRCDSPDLYAKLLMKVAEHRKEMLERATLVSQVLSH